MRVIESQPSRRRFFRSLALAIAGAPLIKLGRVLKRRRRDLSPIPWIGHC